MFSCALCGKIFSTQQRLKNHIVSHIKEKPNKCPTCSATFTYRSTLKTHVQTVHDGVQLPSLECHVCGYKCIGKGNLKMHLLKHSTEFPISCSVAGCSFKTKQKRSLQSHVRRIHLRETPYECKSVGCNYKTPDAGDFHRHLKVHSNKKPFTCPVPGCNYTCNTRPYLTAHTNGVHGEENPWKCSTCDFRTKLRSTLNKHRATHSSMKRFHCQAPNCSYATISKGNYMRHFDVKHRKKQILCTVPRCNYRCGSTAILKTHLKEHELPLLKCPVDSCNFSTRFKDSLFVHTSRNHWDKLGDSLLVSRKPDPANAGPTVVVVETRHCPVPNCGYQTDFPHRYHRHMKAHDLEKQRKYACKFCASRFTQLISLEGHIQRHLGERPYRCSHCDYTAVDGDNLRCHARRVHRIFVIPRGQEHKYDRRCRTCSITSTSYSEFMLHSMTHLKPVVILQRLCVHNM